MQKRYYAAFNEDGSVSCIGYGYDGTEITEDEYLELMGKFERTRAATAAVIAGEIAFEFVDEDISEDVSCAAIAQFAEMVYSGAPIDTVPESMREDVQTAVDALITERGEPDEQEISDTEALNIILGVSE